MSLISDMPARVKLGLMWLNRMPISKDIRNMILKFLFVVPHEKLIQYIKSCGTSFSMDHIYSLYPNKFEFHRLHEVTGKVISKEFTFCRYCGNYNEEGTTGLRVSNMCCCRTYFYPIRPSDALVLKFLQMNLDENHQHIGFVKKKHHDDWPIFTPFDPSDDDVSLSNIDISELNVEISDDLDIEDIWDSNQ